MTHGPFDLSGGPFLFLYLVLFALAWFASLRLSLAVRPEGRPCGRLADVDLAVLAGGLPRYSELVAAQLRAAGYLTVEGGALVLAADAPATPAVRALGEPARPLRWHAAARALAALARAAQQRLVDRGLLLSAGEVWRVRIAQASPFLLLAGFGLVKLLVGEARGRLVGFLAVALIVTLVVAVVRFAGVDARTRIGQQRLAEARRRHERLRRAPTAEEVGIGVALFGTAVLVGSGWEDLHRVRAAGGDGMSFGVDGGGDGDGGGGSDGGGGGCGGGGCGGCSS